MDENTIVARVNGVRHRLQLPEPITLLTMLREVLGLTGAKEGCAQGDCGTCVVDVDGRPVNACLVLAQEVDGAEITSLEGLETGEQLHPLQERFAQMWAFQCGYCTPGMLMSAWCLLQRDPEPDVEAVVEAFEGNLCRCTSYRNVVEATLAAAGDVTRAKQAEDGAQP